MKWIQIKDVDDYALSRTETPNFKLNEFYNASTPNQEFSYPRPLIYAVQIFRDWICDAVFITSTYREFSVGAHKERLAIDFVSSQSFTTKFHNSVMNWILKEESSLIYKLRESGITGFGLEPFCIHLDCGDYGFDKRIHHQDSFGTYTAFEWNGVDVNRSI